MLNVTPSSAPITELPLALIPTATVPLLFALHITAVSALARTPRNHSLPPPRSQPPRNKDNRMQPVIDALRPAAAWPGTDQRTTNDQGRPR